MIKPLGQNLEPHPELNPLDIPEGFPQSMSPVIARKINFPGPFFNQSIDRLDRERLFCFPAGKKIFFVIRPDIFQKYPQCPVNSLVNHQDIILSGLALPDHDGLAGL